MLFLFVKRYTVSKTKIRLHVVHKLKMKQYVVHKGGGGFTFLYTTFADNNGKIICGFIQH